MWEYFSMLYLLLWILKVGSFFYLVLQISEITYECYFVSLGAWARELEHFRASKFVRCFVCFWILDLWPWFRNLESLVLLNPRRSRDWDSKKNQFFFQIFFFVLQLYYPWEIPWGVWIWNSQNIYFQNLSRILIIIIFSQLYHP